MEKNENFLLINKPEGWTSFDVVALVRKHAADASPPFQGGARGGLPSDASAPQSTATPSSLPLGKGEMTKPTKPKRLKVGHAGTLDPFAGGILIAGIGRAATRHLSAFSRMDKKYRAVLRLGRVSDTYDLTGKIKIIQQELRIQNKELRINQAAVSFIGKQKQIPPIYSAKIIKGQRAYSLARQGEKIILPPRF